MQPVLLVGLYYRVSTERQAEKGFSLPEQREACRRKAEELAREAGARLHIEEFEDHISGDHLERPAIDDLRQFARERHPDYIICLDPDRFSRRLINQLILANELERHSKLAFVQHDRKQDPEGQLFFTLRGAIAEYEKAKILERMRRGVIGKLKAGKLPHGHAPFGFYFDTVNDTLALVPAEAEWVKAMFRMWVDGESAPDIAAYFNQMGVPTKRGGQMWYAGTVNTLLKNPAMKGEALYMKSDWRGMAVKRQLPKDKRDGPIKGTRRPAEEWIAVPVPAIVSPELWEAAQARFKHRNAKAKGKLLLSGLVRCGLCGAPVHYTQGSNPGMYNLRCNNKHPRTGYRAAPPPRCPLSSCYQPIAEKAVRAVVLSWLTSPAAIVRAIRKAERVAESPALPSSLEAEIKTLQGQLAEHKKSQSQTLNLLSKGLLDQEVAEDALRSSKDGIKAVSDRLAEVEARLSKLRHGGGADNLEARLSAARAQLGAQDIRLAYAALTLEEEQKLLRHLVAEIRLYSKDHPTRVEVDPLLSPLVLS